INPKPGGVPCVRAQVSAHDTRCIVLGSGANAVGFTADAFKGEPGRAVGRLASRAEADDGAKGSPSGSGEVPSSVMGSAPTAGSLGFEELLGPAPLPLGSMRKWQVYRSRDGRTYQGAWSDAPPGAVPAWTPTTSFNLDASARFSVRDHAGGRWLSG